MTAKSQTIANVQIKELRERTGCGVVDCKEALIEAQGDIDTAITILRKRGIAKAAKKAQRTTREGVIDAYIHNNKRIGTIVSLLCETDFVARNAKFQELAHNIAVHIAAMDPLAVRPEEIPTETLKAEQEIAQQQAATSGKPTAIQEKMIEGKLKKFREEKALLSQPYVKDPSKSVTDLINEAVAELGENITVGGFARIII